jgi:hypothetical protein
MAWRGLLPGAALREPATFRCRKNVDPDRLCSCGCWGADAAEAGSADTQAVGPLPGFAAEGKEPMDGPYLSALTMAPAASKPERLVSLSESNILKLTRVRGSKPTGSSLHL